MLRFDETGWLIRFTTAWLAVLLIYLAGATVMVMSI